LLLQLQENIGLFSLDSRLRGNDRMVQEVNVKSGCRPIRGCWKVQ